MSENDGEKELILGNKQLVSLFFVVVALCGVFFAMGYMVRGNSLKTALPNPDDAASAQVSAAGATVKRQQPEPPRETAESTPADTAPPSTASAADTQSAPETSAKAGPETASAPPPVLPGPKPFTDSAPAAAKPETPQGAADATGTWVQVSALGRADAEATARTLREQHLPASVVPSPKEGLFRVRVGPYHQTSEVSDAKLRLKTLGFSNTIVKKE